MAFNVGDSVICVEEARNPNSGVLGQEYTVREVGTAEDNQWIKIVEDGPKVWAFRFELSQAAEYFTGYLVIYETIRTNEKSAEFFKNPLAAQGTIQAVERQPERFRLRAKKKIKVRI